MPNCMMRGSPVMRRDPPERARPEVRVRQAPVEGVEQVEHLQPQLDVSALPLRIRDATGPDPPCGSRGPLMLLRWCVPNLPGRRLRKRGRIQIVGQRLGAVDVVRDLVDTLVGHAVERRCRGRS